MTPFSCSVCSHNQYLPLWVWDPEKFLVMIDAASKRVEYVACAQCGVAHQYPLLPIEVVDKLHQDLTFDIVNIESHRERAGWLNQRIKLKDNPGRVLEIGCADGKFLEVFRDDYGWEAEGVEPSHKDAAICRQKGFHIFESNVEDADIEGGRYDLVLFFHLLEHLETPLEFLRRINPLIKQGGGVYFEIPNVLQRPRFQITYLPSFHRREFHPLGIKILMQRSGFEIKAMNRVHDQRFYAVKVSETPDHVDLEIPPNVAQWAVNEFTHSRFATAVAESVNEIDKKARKGKPETPELNLSDEAKGVYTQVVDKFLKQTVDTQAHLKTFGPISKNNYLECAAKVLTEFNNDFRYIDLYRAVNANINHVINYRKLGENAPHLAKPEFVKKAYNQAHLVNFLKEVIFCAARINRYLTMIKKTL